MPRRADITKVMIIGSGPIVIGQACEFDYSGTQACKALRKLGYEIVLVNSNPATIMTDPEMADITYVEPLTFEATREIVEKERPDAILPNLGGQSGLNLTEQLARAGVLDEYGVKVIGVEVDAIERGEDRLAFKEKYLQGVEGWINPGDSVIVDPDGKFVAGPAREEETMTKQRPSLATCLMVESHGSPRSQVGATKICVPHAHMAYLAKGI